MIDLTALSSQVATPRLIRKGAVLTPTLNGPAQTLDRLGSRYAADVTLPKMDIEPDGRRWIADLLAGQSEDVSFRYPQVGFDVGAAGAPTVDGAVSGGTTLPITGGTPRYAVRKGQWLSVRRGSGRSYLYTVRAQVILDGSGDGSLTIYPMLRAPLVDGDAVNLAAPVIEGYLDGDAMSWTLEMARTVGLSFSVVERA